MLDHGSSENYKAFPYRHKIGQGGFYFALTTQHTWVDSSVDLSILADQHQLSDHQLGDQQLTYVTLPLSDTADKDGSTASQEVRYVSNELPYKHF